MFCLRCQLRLFMGSFLLSRVVMTGFVLAVPLSAAAAGASFEVDACLRAAASKHGISYPLLYAIAQQESSFNPAVVAASNLDGSEDYGLMQINSRWLPTLARYGIAKQDLFKPCINADVGAWILRTNFERMGVTWSAVGAYNAQSPDKRLRYALAVHSKLKRLSQYSSPVAANTPSTPSNMAVWEQGQGGYQ